MATDPGATHTTVATTPVELPFAADSTVHALLARLGRTEDVRFSPDNRRLAVTAFTEDVVALFDVEITTGLRGPRIALLGATELTAAAFAMPHGIDFLDDDTIVVANRGGIVTAHALPDRRAPIGPITPAPQLTHIGGLHHPGSVRVFPASAGGIEMLVCDNYVSTLVHHDVHADEGQWTIAPGTLLLRRWLDIPDGVAVSDDGRWLAVTNHATQCVLVHARASLDEHAEPVAILRGTTYPHGLHFTRDARHLVVADAGRPFVHVFAAGAEWAGVGYPIASHRIMDDLTFARGSSNPQEGGPKGLDLDRTGRVVAVTSTHQPLAFLDVDALLAHPGEAGAAQRFEYEREVLAHAAERAAAHSDEIARGDAARVLAADAEVRLRRQSELVAAYEQTKLMRVTRPLRRIYGAWRNPRSRPPS